MVRSSRHVAICSSASAWSSIFASRLSSEHHSGAANELLRLRLVLPLFMRRPHLGEGSHVA